MRREIPIYVKQAALCAAVYILLDLPVRLTGTMGFSGLVGPKSFVPLVFGLIYGIPGAIGTTVGAALGAAVSGTSLALTVYEALSVALTGVLSWFGWYFLGTARPVRLKKWSDYGKYTCLAMSLSLLSALCAAIFGHKALMTEVFVGYAVFDLLAGIPVLILMTSIVCVRQTRPRGVSFAPPLCGEVTDDSSTLSAFNDRIEEECDANGIAMRRRFAIQNCIEEFAIRILEKEGCKSIEFEIEMGDSISIYIRYPGIRFNPLRRERGEDKEGMMGLLLIRQRALRASYSRHGEMNMIHVVM